MAHRLATEVEGELDGIWHYIATQSGSIGIAERVIDAVVSRFSLLATHPLLGRRRDSDLRPGLRSIVAGEYVIIYRLQDKDVVILHVVHGRRDLAALFGDSVS
jgi:toxin ParE1/3/4